MRAGDAGEACLTYAGEFASVGGGVHGAILCGHARGAVLARTIFASLSAQFAKASVVADRTNTLVRTGRRGLLLIGERERE